MTYVKNLSKMKCYCCDGENIPLELCFCGGYFCDECSKVAGHNTGLAMRCSECNEYDCEHGMFTYQEWPTICWECGQFKTRRRNY